MFGKKELVLYSERPKFFAEVLAPFAEAGFKLVTFSTLAQLLQYLDPKSPPALVCLDLGELDLASLRAKLLQVLEKCALSLVVTTSKSDPKQYHDYLEGLGLLAPLPMEPERTHGESLLKKVLGNF